MDADCAAQIRQAVGYSRYESKRRKIWADASKPPEELQAVPIYGTELAQRQLRPGACLGLRLSQPRFIEMIRRAVAPGGTRCFAVVTWTVSSGGAEDGKIAEGAMGRLCEIVEHSSDDSGTYVMVKANSPCIVLSVKSEDDFPDCPPLLIGELEEVEENEDDPVDAVPGDIGGESGDNAMVILDDGSVSIRQRQMELELVVLELQRRNLERRRLELQMLMTQRRMLQEMAELSMEVAHMSVVASTVQEMLDLTDSDGDLGQRTVALRDRARVPMSSSNDSSRSQQAPLTQEVPSSSSSRSAASGVRTSRTSQRDGQRNESRLDRTRTRHETQHARSRAIGSSRTANSTLGATLQRRSSNR